MLQGFISGINQKTNMMNTKGGLIMDQKTTLHINIDSELKRKFKVLCMLDNWSIQDRVIALVREYCQHNEYKIKDLDK